MILSVSGSILLCEVFPLAHMCVSLDQFLNFAVVYELVQQVYNTHLIKEAIYACSILASKLLFTVVTSFAYFQICIWDRNHEEACQ